MKRSNFLSNCNRLLDGLKKRIPEQLYDDVKAYVNQHNEACLGMEILADQIGEYDIKITTEEHSLFKQVFESCGIDYTNQFSFLNELVD